MSRVTAINANSPLHRIKLEAETLPCGLQSNLQIDVQSQAPRTGALCYSLSLGAFEMRYLIARSSRPGELHPTQGHVCEEPVPENHDDEGAHFLRPAV